MDKFNDEQKKILNSESYDDIDDSEDDMDIDNDEECILDDNDEDDIELNIITDIKLINNNKSSIIKKNNKRSKVIGKHTLAYDNIHNSKRELNNQLEEEYIIQDLNNNFSVDYKIDTSQNYNSDEYYFSLELKNKILDLLVQHTDIDFSPETKRRIPSVNDVNAYFNLLIVELIDNKYSYTEIFTSFSEFFTDNIWNVYKKLNQQYKAIIYNELKEKYKMKDIEKMDFL